MLSRIPHWRLSRIALAASFVFLYLTRSLVLDAAPPSFSIQPAGDEDTFVGSVYKATLVVQGSPPPTVTVEEPAGAAYNGTVLSYVPPGAAGTEFPVRVRATNDDGEAVAEWTVTIVEPLRLEFEDDAELDLFVDPEIDTPAARRDEVEASIEDGFFQIFLPGVAGDNFDQWCDFDRTPRFRSTTRVFGAFVLETSVTFDIVNSLVPAPINADYHTGLMIDRGVQDLAQFGPIRGGIEYERNCSKDGENSGTVFPGTFVVGDEEVFLRIEVNGTNQKFLGRVDDADPWTLVYEVDGPRPPIEGVGFAAKNWGSQVDYSTLFDYFDYGPLPSVPPDLPDAPMEDFVFADSNYTCALTIEGFPDPAVEIVQPPDATISTAGILSFHVSQAVGTEIPVEIRATNSGGTAQASWTVTVVESTRLEFDDQAEFDDNFFDPMHDNSSRKAEVTTTVASGQLDFFLPSAAGEDFDNWCGFDRTPRFLHNARVTGTYAVETAVGFAQLPTDIAGGYHLGLFVDRGTEDLGMFGPIRNGVEYERNCSKDGENTGTFFSGLFNDPDAVAYLRIEASGDQQRFLARTDPADSWTVISEVVGKRPRPVGVGVGAKNWGGQGDYIASFDYFDYGPSLPALDVPAEDFAFEGGRYTVAVSTQGFPPPTLAVTQPAEATLDADGIISVDVAGAAGSTFDVSVSATSAGGTVEDTWTVHVVAPVQHEFDTQDEFDDNFFDSMNDTPASRRGEVTTEVADGNLEIFLPGVITDNFDQWCGFDRTPRWLHNARVTGSYAVETAASFAQLPTAIGDGYHWGLVVDRGTEGLAQFGPIRNGVEYERNCSADGENTPTFFGGLFNDPDAVAYLRIEADGATQTFLARTSPDDPWTTVSEVVGKRPRPEGIGLGVKNWGSQGDYTAAFDYFDYGPIPSEEPVATFARGDADSSGGIDLTDGVKLLDALFAGGPTPVCLDAADANDSGVLDLTDAVFLFNWLFAGGEVPHPPSPSIASYPSADCGPDPTPDDLDCAEEAEKCK